MKETINLYRGEAGWWMAESSDPEVKRLFGTDTLPTPYANSVSALVVLEEIQNRNPAADVGWEFDRDEG